MLAEKIKVKSKNRFQIYSQHRPFPSLIIFFLLTFMSYIIVNILQYNPVIKFPFVEMKKFYYSSEYLKIHATY